jgi:hypothetical protein
MDKGQSGEETDSLKHAIEYSKIDFPTSLVRCSSTAAVDGADRGSPPLHLGQATAANKRRGADAWAALNCSDAEDRRSQTWISKHAWPQVAIHANAVRLSAMPCCADVVWCERGAEDKPALALPHVLWPALWALTTAGQIARMIGGDTPIQRAKHTNHLLIVQLSSEPLGGDDWLGTDWGRGTAASWGQDGGGHAHRVTRWVGNANRP